MNAVKRDRHKTAAHPILYSRSRRRGENVGCSRRSAGLRLQLGLLLLLLLELLLLGLVLLLELALVGLLLLFGLGDGLEEALEPGLLGALHVLLQPGAGAPDPVLVEVLLGDEELDQALDVGLLPLDVAEGVVGLAHVGLEEQGASVLERPVFGQRILGLRVVLDEIDDLL